MHARSSTTALRRALSVALGLLLAGCSRPASSLLGPNQPPEIEIVSAGPSGPGAGDVAVRWSARDPDGWVKNFRWSVTPFGAPVGASPAFSTAAPLALVPRPVSLPTAGHARPEPELFSVWAVDERGLASSPATLALFSGNVAPTVVITGPLPNRFVATQISPDICIEWIGQDLDGVFTDRPVKYKWTVLTDGTPVTINDALVNPDAIRDYYAPIGWAGWDSTSAESTFASLTSLTLGVSYMFVVTAFDEAGDYDPVFGLEKNMLRMTVVQPELTGPELVVSHLNSVHHVDPGTAEYPGRTMSMEVPGNAPSTFSFTGTPIFGHGLTGYRWVMDPVDLHDETPRTDEVTDTRHWSQWSLSNTSCTVGPFPRNDFKREQHMLYIEARCGPGGCPSNGSQFLTLAAVRMVTVRPTNTHELLIVTDTRLEVDKFLNDPTLQRPDVYTRPWPSKTELDTFLFARGGVPWRGTRNPPSGVTSIPGILAGYEFDTLNTRGIFSGLSIDMRDPRQTDRVPLSLLADYRHVIWLVDDMGGLYTRNLDQNVFPVTALYDMGQFSRANVLATYVAMGGKVWIAGGAAAYASLRAFDRPNNNVGQTTVFSSAPQFNELGSGRIMFEGPHWRSSVAVTKSGIQTYRRQYNSTVLWDDGTMHDTTFIVAPAWSHHDRHTGGTLTSPDYTKLPLEMRWRSATPDPMPPTRLPSQTGLFYPSSYPSEYILEPNSIIEDTAPEGALEHEQSVLDTLFESQGIVLLTSPARASTMTYYHGREARQLVFSGFAPWGYARADCIALVDFVLQDIWGLSRAPIDRGSVAGVGSLAGSAHSRTARASGAPAHRSGVRR